MVYFHDISFPSTKYAGKLHADFAEIRGKIKVFLADKISSDKITKTKRVPTLTYLKLVKMPNQRCAKIFERLKYDANKEYKYVCYLYDRNDEFIRSLGGGYSVSELEYHASHVSMIIQELSRD